MIWLLLSTAVLCLACVFVVLVQIWIKLSTIERMIAMEQSMTRIPPSAPIPQPMRYTSGAVIPTGNVIKGQSAVDAMTAMAAGAKFIKKAYGKDPTK